MSDKVIRVTLSEGGINRAIQQLERYQKSLETRTAKLVDELVDGGAEMARYAFGGWGNVDKISEDGTGLIEVSGENVIIAEFGAGMATMEDHPLAENAPVPIERGSYSELVGSGEFAETYEASGGEDGWWHFGGKEYHQVVPRHGMLDARDYVIDNLESKARKVFGK